MEYKYVARVPMSSTCSHMVHCQTETIDHWSLSYNKTLRRITPPKQLRQAVNMVMCFMIQVLLVISLFGKCRCRQYI